MWRKQPPLLGVWCITCVHCCTSVMSFGTALWISGLPFFSGTIVSQLVDIYPDDNLKGNWKWSRSHAYHYSLNCTTFVLFESHRTFSHPFGKHNLSHNFTNCGKVLTSPGDVIRAAYSLWDSMIGTGCFVVERMLQVLGYMSFICLFGAFPFGLVADHLRSKFLGKRFL